MAFMNQYPAERLVMTAEPLTAKEAQPKFERAKPKQQPEPPPQNPLF